MGDKAIGFRFIDPIRKPTVPWENKKYTSKY